MRLSRKIIIAALILSHSLQYGKSDVSPLRATGKTPRSLEQAEQVTGEEEDQPKVGPGASGGSPQQDEYEEVPEEGGKESQEEEGGEENSGVLLPVLLLGLAFGTYMVRKRFLDVGGYQDTRWIVGNKRDDESEYNTGSLDRRQEMVPLSNEDEWAWEDSARRDLEMGANADDDEEDLHAALEMPPQNTDRNGVKRKSINGGTTSSNGSTNRGIAEKSAPSATKSLTDVGASTPTVPTSPPAKVVPPKQKKSPPMTSKTAPVLSVEEMLKQQSMMGGNNIPVITSLSKPVAIAKPRQTVNKPKADEDDIFASMGLSSNIGKVNNSTHSNVSASASAVKVDHVVPETADSTGWNSSVESDWGDDGDLDDLISDDEKDI